jgi:hypothetical protein
MHVGAEQTTFLPTAQARRDNATRKGCRTRRWQARAGSGFARKRGCGGGFQPQGPFSKARLETVPRAANPRESARRVENQVSLMKRTQKSAIRKSRIRA